VGELILMVVRKTKIETILNDGSKISITLNDNDPKKIMRFLEFLEMFNNNNYENNNNGSSFVTVKSIYDKIRNIVELEFGRASFTLTDLYRAYFLKYNEEIKKSTLATYLTRMMEEGVLDRFGKRGKYLYRYSGPIRIPGNL
jgi:hypothetical protein